MKTSNNMKKMGVISAVGAACILSSSIANAALIDSTASLTFAQGDQVIDSTVQSSFTLNLVANGLEEFSYGGGLSIGFDPAIVSISAVTFDNHWDYAPTNVINNTTGNYTFVASTFNTEVPVDTVSQNILSIDFSILSNGVFDFVFSDIGFDGEWIFTPPIGAQGVGDLNYCLSSTLQYEETTCTDSYSGAQTTALFLDTTSVTVVPVPAAVWLFASGLVGLIGVSRRKRA